eukprot:COSAG02_NODE_47988_length_337_cov_0.743697_1_plen_54_part_10
MCAVHVCFGVRLLVDGAGCKYSIRNKQASAFMTALLALRGWQAWVVMLVGSPFA